MRSCVICSNKTTATIVKTEILRQEGSCANYGPGPMLICSRSGAIVLKK